MMVEGLDAGGLLMADVLVFPPHSFDTLFLVLGHGYYKNKFYAVILSENVLEANIFTRNSDSTLQNDLKNPVYFFLHLLFCVKVQNYKLGIYITLLW